MMNLKHLLVLPAVLFCSYPATSSSFSTPETNFEYLDIKKATSYVTGKSFLYSVMKETGEIGLLTYDDLLTIDVSVKDIDYQELTILECGSSNSFTPRERVVNYENTFGVTGYDVLDSPCKIAINKETKWIDATSLGQSLWYSKNIKGDLQCYSIDGKQCVSLPDYSKYKKIDDNVTLRSLENNAAKLATYFEDVDEVTLHMRDGAWTGNISLPKSAQGKSIVIDVTSTYSVNVHIPNSQMKTIRSNEIRSWVYLGQTWLEEGTNINDYPEIIQIAKPLICTSQDQINFNDGTEGNWCKELLNTEHAETKRTLQSMIDTKETHMDRLFSQMLDHDLLKVDIDNDYPNRILALENKKNELKKTRDLVCATGWWNIPALIACGVLTGQYNDAYNVWENLKNERDAKLNEVSVQVDIGRAMDYHKLHTDWATADATHFSALLKEESSALADLKLLKEAYHQKAEDAHKAYLDAVDKYMTDTKPGNILLNSLEDMPLIGREVQHIVDYADNPSDTNLRRMLLGLAGPVGEAVEGVVEIETGDTELNPSVMTFLTDVLSDLNDDHSIGEALQDIVSDVINDFGSDAIEAIRQAGMWRDNPGQENFIKVDYENIIDLRSQLDPIHYDFWEGSSVEEINVQNNLTPENANFKQYISDPLSYNPSSLIDIEYASGGSKFENRLSSLFAHSFGKNYTDVIKLNAKYADWTSAKINNELYKFFSDPAYIEQRTPYWGDSRTMGQRPAGTIYNNEHAFIVLNSDFVTRGSADFYKFYFEELGHMGNYWRCKIFDIAVNKCQSTGDVGARFRDAVLLDESLHTVPFANLLNELPKHTDVDMETLHFSDGSVATLEGWPSYYTINDHIAGFGKFSWLMRLGLDVASEDLPGVSDEFDIEVVISAPKGTMKGDPWKKSANGYCKTDAETDCNMPTMWVSVAFRDAIKYSIAKLPKVKNTKLEKAGADLSPRMVRKHSGKLPFQLTSVKGTDWKYMNDYNIYAKKFTVAAEVKLDFFKMGTEITKGTPSRIHKPELSLKSTPLSASYLVEIATKDKKDFAGWLSADIASSVIGCAGGFIAGVISDSDPVVMCHAASDVLEGVETAFQALDHKPTMIVEADGNITLPISLEYKYATTGEKVKGAFSRGQVHADTTTNPHIPDEGISGTSIVENTNITSLKEKTGKALSKLSRGTIAGVGVFRFRIGFDYAKEVVSKGAYALPASIVGD